MVDPLVDKAIEILKNIDRETATGAFEKPFDSGGAYGGDEWLSNPHFRITFASRGEDAPSKAKISVTCAEGREGGDDEGTTLEPMRSISCGTRMITPTRPCQGLN